MTPYQRHIASLESIPPELRDLPIWCAWRLVYEQGKQKPDKRPISPITGRGDKWTSTGFCTHAEQAIHYAEAQPGLHGIGLVLYPEFGIAGGDLDHCRDVTTGESSSDASTILAAANTYTEVSPSLTGYRFLFFGSFGGHTGNDSEKGVELYESGRFLTFTGNQVDGSPFAIEARDLTELGKKHFFERKQSDKPSIEVGQFEPVDIHSLNLMPWTLQTISTGGDGNDRSETIWGVLKDMIRAGCDDLTICRVLADSRYGISAKALENRGGNIRSAMQWIASQVRKARTEVISEVLPEYAYSSEALKPVEFVIDGFIANRLTLIAGAPGVGKSTALVSMAAIAAGIVQFDGVTAELRRTVFYVTEDAEQIERILYGMRAQGLTTFTQGQMQSAFKIIHAKRRQPDEVAAMIAAARKLGMTEHPSGYKVEPLIVLDTSNATLDLDNENDNSQAGKAIAAIKETLGGASLWIVGHTAKAVKRADLKDLSFRGAGAFEGDCNATTYLFSDQSAGKDVRYLALGKHRYVSQYQEVRIDSMLGKESVSTGWGTMQDCWYCVGVPSRSSAKEREDMKQASIDVAARREADRIKRKILFAVMEATNQGESINRSRLKQIVGGKAATVGGLVNELISTGWMAESKTEGKKGFDLMVLKDPDADVPEGNLVGMIGEQFA